MNKSLLELLEEEKKEVENFRFYNTSASNFINYAENKEEGYHEDSCYRIASGYEEKAKKSQERLEKIRNELKQYLSFLMELEGDKND